MKRFLFLALATWIAVDAQAQRDASGLYDLSGGSRSYSAAPGMSANGRTSLGKKQLPNALKAGNNEWKGKTHVDIVIGSSLRDAPVLRVTSMKPGDQGVLSPGLAFIADITDDSTAYIKILPDSKRTELEDGVLVRVEEFDFSFYADGELFAPIMMEVTGRTTYRSVEGNEVPVAVLRPVAMPTSDSYSSQLYYREYDLGAPGSTFEATFYGFDPETQLVHLVMRDHHIVKIPKQDLGAESNSHVQKLIYDFRQAADYNSSLRGGG